MWKTQANNVEKALERLTLELREQKNRYGLTHHSMAEKIGTKARTVDNYMAGQDPQLAIFLRMVELFGPDFLNAIIEPLGMGGVYAIDSDKHCPLQLISLLNQTSSEIALAIEDEVYSPSEKRRVDQLLDKLVDFAGRFKKRKAGRV